MSNIVLDYKKCLKQIKDQIELETNKDNTNTLLELDQTFYSDINEFIRNAKEEELSVINTFLKNLSETRFTKCKIIIGQKIVAENTCGEFQLSYLNADFYKTINHIKAEFTIEQAKTIESLLEVLLRKRIVKLTYQFNQPDTKKIHDYLTDEEYFFWESVSFAQKELRKRVVGRSN